MDRRAEVDLESISALLDDESDDLSIRRLLKSYDSNEGISETWRRYNLTQSILHGDDVILNPSLRARIKKQLDNEPKGRPPGHTPWREGLFKVGLAASVAVICVLLAQGSFKSISDGSRLAEQNSIEDVSSQSGAASLVQTYETGLDAKAQELLKEYISRIEIDKEDPPQSDHIQESPLFRLVNDLQSRNNQ
jgi:sigma-E factor negative regulatory protein RseA